MAIVIFLYLLFEIQWQITFPGFANLRKYRGQSCDPTSDSNALYHLLPFEMYKSHYSTFSEESKLGGYNLLHPIGRERIIFAFPGVSLCRG